MNRHLYLRAYMAGIAVPTVFFLIAMFAFTLANYRDASVPIDRVIVFPMVLIPNFWGAWNVLYAWLNRHRQIPIGLHGAALVVLIVPIGFGVAKLLGFVFVAHDLLIGPAVALIVYYLLWKYVVSFLNRVVDIA